MNVGRAASVFAAGVMLDVVWARYTIAVQARRAVVAATFAAAILLFGAVGVTAYVDDPIYLVPAIAGAFVGTYLAVRSGHD